jgi:hypothetical protein
MAYCYCYDCELVLGSPSYNLESVDKEYENHKTHKTSRNGVWENCERCGKHGALHYMAETEWTRKYMSLYPNNTYYSKDNIYLCKLCASKDTTAILFTESHWSVIK